MMTKEEMQNLMNRTEHDYAKAYETTIVGITIFHILKAIWNLIVLVNQLIKHIDRPCSCHEGSQ